MKKLLSACVLCLLAHGAHALPTHYYGEIDGSGEYTGAVTRSDAWANPPLALNQGEQHVNLWGLEASAGQTLSLSVNGMDGFNGGFSLYFGEVTNTDLLFNLFDNNGDIGAASYLTGTTTFGADSSLSDIALDNDGFYTLIVGGKGFGWDDHYEYNMDVQMSSVSEAGSLLLMSTGLLGIFALRRRPARERVAKNKTENTGLRLDA